MKLGVRILLALALLLAVLVASLALPLIRLVLGEFDRIEQTMAFSRVEDLHLALENLLRQQAMTVVDWANWDAMARFVQDLNPEFQKENLGVKTLDDLGLEALLIFDAGGEVVWGQAIAHEEIAFIPPDEELLTMGRGAHPLFSFDEEHPVRMGLLPGAADWIRLAVAAPILTSEREGPARGTVVMVTRLGQDELAALVVGLEPVFVDSAHWPAFSPEVRVNVQVADGQSLTAHAFFRDMQGKPLNVLEVSLPRTIYRQGVRTVALFGLVLLCALALFSWLFFLALRRMVVTRVECLGREVLRIAEKQHAGNAVAISGRDELSRLAQDINRLLAHREEMSRTLVESRQQYDELFRRMLNGFAHHEMICDAQGRPVDYRFLSVNPAFEHLTGLKAETLVGRTVREILPDTEPFWIETYGRVALTGEAAQFDYDAAALGKHFEVSAFRPAPGQFACVFSDVTERKRDEARIKDLLDEAVQARGALLGILEDQQRAERERSQLDARFRALIENAPDGVVLVSREGKMVFVSPSARRMFGFSREEEVGDTVDLSAFTHPDDRDLVLGTLAQLLQDPARVFTLEYRFRTRAGDWIWVESIFSNLLAVPGVDAIVINFRDIQDRKMTELEREELQRQLQQSQKMESVGRLAGGVAHEFNNMLQIIMGNVELLQLQTKSGGPDPSNIEDIRKAAQHAADLTRQLLAYARKQVAMPRTLDLNQKVGGMLTMLQRLLGEGVDLKWNLSPDPMRVSMDPAQIDQILVNLILNARDALQVGGKVLLETAFVSFNEQDKVRPLHLAPGPYVCLSVTDTGCGMSDAVLGSIFEPFFTTKPLGKGTGLGLPTVYGIVKQNKGELVVRSEVGKGSSFQIYLPLLSAVPDTSEEKALQAPATGGRERVLVAEDEEGICRLLKRTLESLGYSVQAFSSPEAALEAARVSGATFDLLVSDLVMPGMSGSDLFREVRDRHPAIKGLFISGYSEEYIARSGLLEEATAFLPKPFTSEELAEKTRAILTGTHQQR